MELSTQPTTQAILKIATLDELLSQSQLTNSILLFVLAVAVGVFVCYLLYKALTFYDIF